MKPTASTRKPVAAKCASRIAPTTVKIAILGGSLLFDAVLTPEKGGGYSCEVPAMPGCFSCGDTFEEASAMIADAAQLHFTALLERVIEEGTAALRSSAAKRADATPVLA